MNPRNTNTGNVLEDMVLPALERGGYKATKQVYIGKRIGGKRHRVDVLAVDKEGNEYLVSMKWQQTSGTAEQKVPFEVISLAQANKEKRFKSVYLVLAGTGWTLKEYYLGGEFKEHLTAAGEITIIGLEEFISIANDGKL